MKKVNGPREQHEIFMRQLEKVKRKHRGVLDKTMDQIINEQSISKRLTNIF